MKTTAPLIILLLIPACSSAPEDREAHMDALAIRHQGAADEFLHGGSPLTLEDCIRIAEDRSLEVRTAELERRLAEIDTDIAFSAFLPRIEATGEWTNLSEKPMLTIGGAGAQVSDQHLSEFTIGAQLPIFVPQTWLIYSARKTGESVSTLVVERMRQHIALSVTAHYYACLSIEEAIRVQAEQVRQAERLLEDSLSREREGLLTQTDREEVELLLLLRGIVLSTHRRTLAREKAELLRIMDLPPMAKLELAVPAGGQLPSEQDLADLVTSALLHRPELFAADRMIDIRRDELQMAIADFLPRVIGTGGFFNTTDSFVVNPSFFSGGLAGVLTVFDGLKNVRKYEAAEVRVEVELLARERTALAVILEVIEAHRGVQDAAGNREVAVKRLEIAERRVADMKARWSEGLVLDADRLEALAARDQVRAVARAAHYREQVATATLRNVTNGYGSDQQ